MIIPRITTPEITHTWRSIGTDAALEDGAVAVEDIRYLNVRNRSTVLQAASM
jgi:hypothetical protein